MNREEKEQIKKRYFALSQKLFPSFQAYLETTALIEQKLALHALALEGDFSPDQFFPAVVNTSESNNYSNEAQNSQPVIEYDNLIKTTIKIREFAKTKNRIYLEDLLEMHFDLYRRTRYAQAGKFRISDSNGLITGKERSHHTILEEQCSQHLKWLSDRVKLFEKASPTNFFEIFYVATEIHLRLRQADPFDCGSTVFAILLNNYVHYYTGLLPNIIFYEDRQTYLELLKKSNMADFSILINFFLNSFQKTFRISGSPVN